MRKKALIEMIVKIILERIRNERGRLTRISNTCKINRGKLTDEAMTHVRFNQLILLFYAVCLNLKPCARTKRQFQLPNRASLCPMRA